MEAFSYTITALSVIGALSLGFVGLYLNFKYPKSKIEQAEMELHRLRRELAEWRERAERCEQLVVRSFNAHGGGGVQITDSEVHVGRDVVGGDVARGKEAS